MAVRLRGAREDEELPLVGEGEVCVTKTSVPTGQALLDKFLNGLLR